MRNSHIYHTQLNFKICGHFLLWETPKWSFIRYAWFLKNTKVIFGFQKILKFQKILRKEKNGKKNNFIIFDCLMKNFKENKI